MPRTAKAPEFLALLGAAIAAASPPASRFEVPGAITASNAARVYQEYLAASKQGKQVAKGEVGLRDKCDFGQDAGFECILSDEGVIYLPPYPIALPHNLPVLPRGGTVAVRRWAPQDEVRDGAAKFARWKELALSGLPFDCDGPRCHVIVEALVPEQETSEISYAACEVTSMATRWAAPAACEQIAILHGSHVWLNAIIGARAARLSMGRPNLLLHLRGIAPKFDLPTSSSFALALKGNCGEALRLDFEVGADYLAGYSLGRPSVILQEGREQLDIYMHLRSLPGSPGGLGLTTKFNLVVNPQNTDRNQDWHLPSRQQEAEYEKRIRDCVSNAVHRVCKEVIRLDAAEVTCVR